MERVILKEPGIMKYEQRPIPKPINHEVLIKIKKLGICGSDIHAYGGNQAFFSYPRIIGHEICGEIVDSNGSKRLNMGDRVTVMPYMACYQCTACRNEKQNCCEKLQVLGVHLDGAAAEYMTVPKDYVIPVNDIEEDNVALIEPLAISAHAVRRAKVNKGQKAIVIGLGTIGLGAAALLESEGLEVVGIDISESRIQHFEDQLNLKAYSAEEKNLKEIIYKHFHQEFPMLVLDATGNKKSMENAVQYLSHGGQLIFVGFHKGNIEMNDIELHKREATLLRSRAATKDDFYYVMDHIKNGKMNPKEFMITHKIPFNQWVEQFEQIINDTELLKCIIEF